MKESEFARAVRNELASARRGRDPFACLHHAFAIILEEVDELWDECRKKRKNRKAKEVLHELVQIGAMAQRAAEDLGLVRP